MTWTPITTPPPERVIVTVKIHHHEVDLERIGDFWYYPGTDRRTFYTVLGWREKEKQNLYI